MQKKSLQLIFSIFMAVWLVSCEKDNNPKPEPDSFGSSFIINYGSYSGDKGGITLYNRQDSAVTNNYFEEANGVSTISNIQYAYQLNDRVYFCGNNADQVFWTDAKTIVQTEDGISGSDLVKPRYCVANGDILYVSCWGGDVWSDPSVSYITKINSTTNQVIGKIPLPGGPEGLAIARGKLYAALNYDKKIAVIKLSGDSISYIEAPAVSSYFVKDADENLYVSLVSSYSVTVDKEGIGYIKTFTDEMTVYEKTGVSTSYSNILDFSNDFSKLYVMTTAYDINWNLSGSVEVFNTLTKTFETEPLVSGISGLNGISVDKVNSDIQYFVAENATSNGKMVTIKPDGTFVKEYETGISPFMMLNIKNATND
ncbi:MAG: hypothetical protein U0W24_01055 [Bacteroidales bacterium]